MYKKNGNTSKKLLISKLSKYMVNKVTKLIATSIVCYIWLPLRHVSKAYIFQECTKDSTQALQGCNKAVFVTTRLFAE